MRTANNLATFMYLLSENPGAVKSGNIFDLLNINVFMNQHVNKLVILLMLGIECRTF